ncbi:MAG: hypothetical protein MJA83_05005, partial [Gammaproteobacteria bacterium]|nr:hypothetical protein [Gammaproteobacteria bacterium]
DHTAQSYFYALLQAAYYCGDPDPSKLDFDGILTAFEDTLPPRAIESFRHSGRTSERDVDHFSCE